MQQHDSRGDRCPRELALSGVEGARRWRSLGWLFNRTINVFWSALREIFDESAYARFLARQNVPSSPCAYAAFMRETQKQRETRPRCC
jgi:hypothetical protein